MAPGANIGDGFGVFEATHGTAPKYADKDVINPSSVMLSGAMMLEFMGWKEAAELIENGIAGTIQQKRVTYDLERLMTGASNGAWRGRGPGGVGGFPAFFSLAPEHEPRPRRALSRRRISSAGR